MYKIFYKNNRNEEFTEIKKEEYLLIKYIYPMKDNNKIFKYNGEIENIYLIESKFKKELQDMRII